MQNKRDLFDVIAGMKREDMAIPWEYKEKAAKWLVYTYDEFVVWVWPDTKQIHRLWRAKGGHSIPYIDEIPISDWNLKDISLEEIAPIRCSFCGNVKDIYIGHGAAKHCRECYDKLMPAGYYTSP